MSDATSSGGRRRAEAPAQHSIEEILEAARQGVERISPEDLPAAQAQGAHVIDIRSVATREPEGHIPGATVIERLVLEWRLDPGSEHRMPEGPGHDDLVVVVCNEGYSSSLAPLHRGGGAAPGAPPPPAVLHAATPPTSTLCSLRKHGTGGRLRT